MRLREIEARIVRLEQGSPGLTPGPHRMSDDEIRGLVAAIHRVEVEEDLDLATDVCVVALMRREGMLPCA